MSAKLLHSLSGENPDLQKQIGCLSGIFQIFDRHHFLSGRRSHHHNRNRNHKRQQLPAPAASSGGQGHGRKNLNTALQRPPPTVRILVFKFLENKISIYEVNSTN